MTEEQFKKARRFIVRQAAAAGVDVREPDKVIRWLVENPLPADFEDQTDTKDEDDRQARIEKLRAELAKLEGTREVR
jgi:hypothetical protein